ncbi:ABC-2 transporter family protein [Mycolicibacterium hassiacum DSM 44199]|uniref:ABC-2 transporter family protein n=1 Tax=Mycolicibacterium hassiacum (strain DSM 44199 / CIP 105218 / JCM 12690 / 3849) TaxID=1122247 RepID=K5B9D1_MYCHD|nr:ABC transporter [Mycolicibacterium hassiacum]EKF25238.1 ABC-2 transporter family protein [Mycolicibacterium hassiacum DSM 44199]PZN14416.1 MAG: ABC transporter permease [Mycolicibacterium hassiacum]VCT89190.1 hypothetical protein MHAS_00877 [Mycolicibacterium hassiacum DSM 44199]
MTAAAVVRSLRAERIRTGGLSRLWAVTVPAAIAIPAAITVGIALVAEAFARIPGQISVLQVSTSNAAYWVITITTTLVAVAAADGQASENRYSTAEHVRLALQSRLSVLFGRWLFYAGLGAVVAAVTLVVVLWTLPVLAPTVYGSVSWADPVGLRLLWTVPLLAVFAAGAGVGVGSLMRSPLAAVSAILLWAFVAETAAGYLPSGVTLQRFMPLLNAVYATGQDTVLTPPWGPNSALLYTCAVFTSIFAIAAMERTIRQ